VSASHSWNLLVFRDGRRVLNGRDLLRELRGSIHGLLSISNLHTQSAQSELIEALLRSGELECALADSEGCNQSVETLVQLTDRLAHALVGQSTPRLDAAILKSIAAADVPERVTVSTPEGFCYYALHPLDYSDLLNENAIDASAAAIVGIRSIGTTLSAIVRAWFELRGIPAERITVRPSEHPFDRRLSLSEPDREWIVSAIQRDALFLVVDEGPGLSGSSFLAVAEALVQQGVSHNRIILLPSSSPNLSSLLAPDAATRWSRFRTIPLKPTRRVPAEASEDIGWGKWRETVFADERDCPAVWGWTERRKFLSADKRRLFRFDGHGHFGKTVRARSQMLAENGWGPEIRAAEDGFSESPWIEGTRLSRADQTVVLQLARYCAFRASHFEHPVAAHDELEFMTRTNLERALGVHYFAVLPIERPVVADGRMMPHEWIATSARGLLKVDAASHGDDHFYPGPTDIAWDVAGTIAEWNLDQKASDLLVREYERISGDAIEARLPAYLIAYCAFRLGFALSAARSLNNDEEAARFKRDAEMHSQTLSTLLPRATAA